MRRFTLQRILCVLFLLAATSGCIRPEAIAFHGVSDINLSLSGSPAVALVLDVENGSSHNLTIQEAVFSVCRQNGDRIGRVWLSEAVTLPRKSRTDLNVPLRVSLDNMLTGLALLGDPESAVRQLYVSGKVAVKAGCLKRRFTIDRMPLSAFMERFGFDPTAVLVSENAR